MFLRLAAVAAVAAAATTVHAGPLQDDLVARRSRLLAQLSPGTVAVVWSAPPRVFSLDVDYEYRQDSDLFYLTGLTQEESILVLVPGAKTMREVLFVREPNARREHWNGHVLTKEEVTAETGIGHVYFVPQFESFVTSLFNRTPWGARRNEVSTEFDALFDAIAGGRASLALPFGPRPAPSAPLPPAYEFAAKARDRFIGVSFVDSAPLIAALRQVKTPFEQTLMQESATISGKAHMAGMAAARPGVFEYQVEAAIEHAYLANGAMSWGYKGYTVDITRSYPVSGSFTPAQKDLYRLVLDAQEAGMRAARIGNTTRDVEKAAEEVVKAGLLKLGLITDAAGDQFRTWYTHGICHWIGLDVHDVGDYKRPLAAGMTFVVEPGLYIRPQALDALPDTPEHRAFKTAVAPAVQKYAQTGLSRW